MGLRKNLTFIDPTPIYKLADRPEWLLGGEEGSNPPRTEFTEEQILFGLCSVTFYSEFNASMGFQILYNIASGQKDVVCERLFYPELKIEKFLRKSNIPLFSLESKLSGRDFDILAFSIFHIPEYLNILEYFDLVGIPYTTAQRLEGRYPLVISGGIFTLNPEPVAPFCDVICIGDGDQWTIDFLNFYRKNRHLWETTDLKKKYVFLTALAIEVPGTYVPCLTDVSYDDVKGKIIRTSSIPSQESITKRVHDITKDTSLYLKNVIMSRTEKEAFTKAIEVSRGCRWGCRFCVVTAFYKPYRERPLSVLEEIVDYRATLGIKQIGVGAPTPPDYSHISELANYIIGKGLRFDIQSERMDTFSYESAKAHVLSGRGNVSLAIEAPCLFTRQQINKNLPEETIMTAVTNGFKAGFRGIKLMFMLCHPWETVEDVKSFESLLTKIFELREKYHPQTFLRVSICPFIPKPWTTFQWAPLREDDSLFRAANQAIESARRTPIGAHRFAVQFAGGPTSRWFDTVFSRGDRRLADVFILIHQHGKPADKMRYEFPYNAATQDCVNAIKGYAMALRLPLDKWLNGSPVEDDLPWDFVNIGVRKEWLKKDWIRAKEGKQNISCKDGCAGCGACQIYPDVPHPNSYKRDDFKLDVTFKEFIEARKKTRGTLPYRLFTLQYIKNDMATKLNFQDLRRQVCRVFEKIGYEADVSGIDCATHLFNNGMTWGGVDVVNIPAYVPLECDMHILRSSLSQEWNLGEITYFSPTESTFKLRLEGITVNIPIKITPEQIEEFEKLRGNKYEFLRIEGVTEKKRGEGQPSEKINPMDYLLGISRASDGSLDIDMKRGGDAYEFIQIFFNRDKKGAESIPVTVRTVLMKESWSK